MEFGKQLAKYRAEHDIDQKDIADLLNITPQTVSNYETGKNKIPYEKLITLCNHYKINPLELICADLTFDLDEEKQHEQQILSVYNSLPFESDKKRIVDFILEIGEYDTSNVITFPEHEQELKSNATNVYVCPQKASAGIGKIEDESNPDLKVICFEDIIVPQGTTHGIIIDGHSMENRFFDKQIVFIQNGLECAPSDYGIFSVTDDHLETKIYCKQLMQYDDGSKYLHSVNTVEGDPDIDYKNVIEIHCIGKILL